MTVNTHFTPVLAVKSVITAGGIYSRYFATAALILLLLATGCAKHPSSTDPIHGKATGQGVCSTARSAIGVKYKPGGTKPATGFDCSGLVCWVFSQHGINLPRTAKEQSRSGMQISKDKLRPGDLVVFKISSRTGFHTGVYTGNGKFIHSPSRGKTVREESIHADYWKRRFLTARRIPQVR